MFSVFYSIIERIAVSVTAINWASGLCRKSRMLPTFDKTYPGNEYAESVRQFQPRVALSQPWEISFHEDATLKELRRRLLTTKPRNPFRVANNLLGHF